MAPVAAWQLKDSADKTYSHLAPSTIRGPDGAWSSKEVAWFHTLSLVAVKLDREGRGLPPELWLLVARGALPDALPGSATTTILLNRRREHGSGGMSATEAVHKRGTLKLSLTPDGLLKVNLPLAMGVARGGTC